MTWAEDWLAEENQHFIRIAALVMTAVLIGVIVWWSIR